MNRLLLLVFSLLPFLCNSQSYGLCIQVLSPGGGSGAQGNYDVSWTIGEMAVTTLRGTDHKATQGFHQPDICMAVSTWNLDLEALGIDVFPNPSSSYFNIRFTDSGEVSLIVTAFDVLGHQVLQAMPLDTPEGTLLDASAWPPGLYIIQIEDTYSNARATLRVVRL